MKKLLFSLPPKSAKKDFIFNMYGSMVMSFVSVFLLVIVSRVLGEEQAGIFSLVYSTAQMMYIIAAFEVRNIQVTDEKKEFTFADCFSFRIITIIFMLIFAVFFCFLNSFDLNKTVATVLLCLYMSFLAMSELFQGNIHKHGYLFISGFSLGTSVLLAAISFIVTIIVSQNLNMAIVGMVIAMFLWTLLFDTNISSRFDKIKLSFDFKKIGKLFIYTLPLLISVFLNQYSINCPKYAIDKYLTNIEQSHYGYLVMPAFCVNLLSIFVFRPQILTLSSRWENKEFKSFNKLVGLLFGWIILASIIVLAGGFIAGIPVLEWLYGVDLSGKKIWLMVLLISGGFSAASSLCCVLVAVTRKQNLALFAYAASAVLSLILPNVLVKNMEFSGAPIAYLIQNIVLFTALFIILYFTVFSKGVNKNTEIKEKEND